MGLFDNVGDFIKHRGEDITDTWNKGLDYVENRVIQDNIDRVKENTQNAIDFTDEHIVQNFNEWGKKTKQTIEEITQEGIDAGTSAFDKTKSWIQSLTPAFNGVFDFFKDNWKLLLAIAIYFFVFTEAGQNLIKTGAQVAATSA